MTATLDRNAVQAGDVITWRTRNGGHEATGVVQWATRDAVHVEIPARGIYAVEWPRVESVTAAHTHPRGVICSPAWCGSDGPNAGVLDR